MPPFVEIEKPTIRIHVVYEVQEEVLNQILYGIEEEGIPFKIEKVENKDIVSIAHDAAQESRLDVGLGISAELAVLHFAKLSIENPLFKVSCDTNYQGLRAIGANAGRLVKKLPLKPIN